MRLKRQTTGISASEKSDFLLIQRELVAFSFLQWALSCYLKEVLYGLRTRKKSHLVV